jgi:transcriptional regulator with XRE-family HTH domain
MGHVGHEGDVATCQACRLQRARLRLGLSQAGLAERTGRSERAIRAWERGETTCDQAVLLLAETWALSVPEKPPEEER